MILFLLVFVGCKKEGCKHPLASNYNPKVKESNLSMCVFPECRDEYIGLYLVNRVYIYYNSFGIKDTLIGLDTVEIKPHGDGTTISDYNKILIEHHLFSVDFNSGKLTFHTNLHKYPPSGSGNLKSNQLNYYVHTQMFGGGTFSTLTASGYKIE